MVSSRMRLILVVIVATIVNMGVSAVAAAQRGNPPDRGNNRGDEQRRGEQRGTGAVGITIFAEPGFRGLSANFRTDVPNLLSYNMNDRTDSLQIGRGEIWQVCQDKDYKGRCQVFSADEPDLVRIGWAGAISSMRRVSDDRRGGFRGDQRGDFPPPPPMRPRLVLFDDTGFRGHSAVVTNMTSGLHVLGNRVRSAKVYGGAWELCDGDRFRGRCVTVTDSVPDLDRIGLRDRVSSARPAGRDR